MNLKMMMIEVFPAPPKFFQTTPSIFFPQVSEEPSRNIVLKQSWEKEAQKNHKNNELS